VAVPAYDALTSDVNLSRRIADILVCNFSHHATPIPIGTNRVDVFAIHI